MLAKERSRPLLLVDIDGVISLFGFSAGDLRAGMRDGQREVGREGGFHSIDGIPHFLSTAAAENLLSLVSVFDLAWCSGWEEKADEYLPHLLGLPSGLPFLRFERDGMYDGVAQVTRAHWKLAAIDGYAGPQRPLAWIDDAFDESCHEWAAARAGPTLLVQTAPEIGLTRLEALKLTEWAGSQGQAEPRE
ncbi:MAG TPA: hypothetical protein VIC06_07230 [Solirubrobacteraceae bacterium]